MAVRCLVSGFRMNGFPKDASSFHIIFLKKISKNFHQTRFRFGKSKKKATFAIPNWYHGRVVRQRSAKPCTAVRLCLVPHKKRWLNRPSFFCFTYFIPRTEPILSDTPPLDGIYSPDDPQAELTGAESSPYVRQEPQQRKPPRQKHSCLQPGNSCR